MTKKVHPHTALVKACCDILSACKIWHYKHWGGPMGKTGIADIIGIFTENWPTEMGIFLAIECKTGKAKLSKKQAEFLQEVNDNGGIGIEVRSPEELVEKLNLNVKL